MKKISLLLILLSCSFAISARADIPQESSDNLNETYSVYEKFKFKDSMNWGDCFDFDIGIGFDVCVGFKWGVPYFYPTVTLTYEYLDPIALVEVVPDPWRSFLYKDSFYDFSGKADTAIAGHLGIKPTIGSGLSNRKATNGKSFIGQNKMETHVWAVGDWWRLMTSDPIDACISMTCKNKDFTGCILSVKQTFTKVSDGMTETIQSVNENLSALGKGQGVMNGETGDLSYEDGSVFEEKEFSNIAHGEKNTWTQYVEVREPGNYGMPGMAEMAEVATSESFIPGMSNAELAMEGFQAVKDPEGYIIGKAVGAATDEASSAWESSDTKASLDSQMDSVSESWENSSIKQDFDSGVSAVNGWGDDFKQSFMPDADSDNELPYSTTRGGELQATYDLLDSVSPGSNSFQAGAQISDHAMANNTADNHEALAEMRKYTGMAADLNGGIGGIVGDTGGGGGMADMTVDIVMQKAAALMDRVVYFNVIEQVTQMIATVSPIMVHPVYMSERHEKATGDGGFFWADLYQKAAEMGAGLVMPIFCLSKSGAMSADALMNIFDYDIPSDVLGPISEFINARCVGSWGPLEPRVNLIGSGDHMVAAGLASVRGLNIAQNITGDFYNKTINNTPFNSLKFNLAWPHQSGCYGFQGASGLSRGWTTPLGGVLDKATQAISSGNPLEAAAVVGKETVGKATSQGGYVFTYWKQRKCRYLLACNDWRGDTGI